MTLMSARLWLLLALAVCSLVNQLKLLSQFNDCPPLENLATPTTSGGIFSNAAVLNAIAAPRKASYTVCNGMSNQLLGHFSALSFALDNDSSITMPDAYIINGVQSVVDGQMDDITPTAENSIPIGQTFDMERFRELITGRGNTANDLHVVPSDKSLSCDGWSNCLQKTVPRLSGMLWGPSHRHHCFKKSLMKD
jgi:hypothetical protein